MRLHQKRQKVLGKAGTMLVREHGANRQNNHRPIHYEGDRSMICPICKKSNVTAGHILGHAGGKAGTGAAKRRTTEQARTAGKMRWAKARQTPDAL